MNSSYLPFDEEYPPPSFISSAPSSLLRNLPVASKRLSNLAYEMGLNIGIVNSMLPHLDYSLPEDRLFNDLLDRYGHASAVLELNFQNKIKEERKEPNWQKSQIRHRRMHQKIDEREKNKECHICLETKKTPTFLVCGHGFCEECLMGFIENKVLNGQVKGIVCPEEKCGRKLKKDEIVKRIRKKRDLLMKYEKFKRNKKIEKDPNLRFCIRIGCEDIVRKNKSENFGKCACGVELCFLCGQNAHKGLSCEQSIDKAYLNYAIQAKVKTCPRCMFPIEKNGGCNHLTCSRCSFEFCWICLSAYTFNHFDNENLEGCPGMQFTNLDEAHPARIRAIRAIRIAKHYLIQLLKIILVIILLPFILIGLGIAMPSKFYSYQQQHYGNYAYLNCYQKTGLILIGLVLLPLGLIYAVIYLPIYLIDNKEKLF